MTFLRIRDPNDRPSVNRVLNLHDSTFSYSLLIHIQHSNNTPKQRSRTYSPRSNRSSRSNPTRRSSCRCTATLHSTPRRTGTAAPPAPPVAAAGTLLGMLTPLVNGAILIELAPGKATTPPDSLAFGGIIAFMGLRTASMTCMTPSRMRMLGVMTLAWLTKMSPAESRVMEMFWPMKVGKEKC